MSMNGMTFVLLLIVKYVCAWFFNLIVCKNNTNNIITVDDEKEEKKPELVPERVLAIIEEAYPNSLTIDDMSRRFKTETEIVRNMVLELVDKKLVKPVGAGLPGAAGLDSAAGAFRRVHHGTEEVTIVKQMPRAVERAMQPTIAVITAQYFEKMAVDAMMTNKQTFMRYATVGRWTAKPPASIDIKVFWGHFLFF